MTSEEETRRNVEQQLANLFEKRGTLTKSCSLLLRWKRTIEFACSFALSAFVVLYFRDACCTITLCDVTLGDHEIKPESSTDLAVNLTDVKVLNSTAIKLKLSAKNPQDVTVEISDNNHVWRQQKPDKGENIRTSLKNVIVVIDDTVL